MKRFLASIFLLLLIPVAAHAQYASRIIPRTADPISCTPGNGEVYYNTTTNALRQCIALNTWQNVGLAGSALNLAQGTLTANTPAINTTATWNNVAVTFTNWFTNVTDTASAADSLLADLQVGGVSQFSVGKAGVLEVAAAGTIGFTGRSEIASSANGIMNATNAAGTAFTRFVLGPETVEACALQPEAVGGESQGVMILRGDGTPQVFANLGAATNGTVVYCNDCTKATPCAGAGNGALAKRLNGAWDCD